MLYYKRLKIRPQQSYVFSQVCWGCGMNGLTNYSINENSPPVRNAFIGRLSTWADSIPSSYDW